MKTGAPIDVAVVGAGMAGLTAARRLDDLGFAVTVVDKGRAVGGRMATRRFAGGRFDHGAQHFSARSEAFRLEVEGWLAAGAARVWFESQSVTNPQRGVEPRHAGVEGMRGIPEHLARGVEVRTGHEVTEIVAGRQVVVAGDSWRMAAGSVVVTAPLPQTLALLDRSGIRLSPARRETLEAIEYDATLAVMAVADDAPDLNEGHVAFAEGPIAWIADNRHKGISDVPALTIHSSADFAAAHLAEEAATWTAALAREASIRLGVGVGAALGHRWRYSQPRTTLDRGAVAAATQAPIVLAGEVFAGARVEGAYRSGLDAAELIAGRLG